MSLPRPSERSKDRLAAAAIRFGGGAVVLLIAAILAGILYGALPVFRGATAGPVEELAVGPGLAVGSDPAGRLSWVLGRDGRIRIAGKEVPPIAITDRGELELSAADHEIGGLLTALGGDGLAVVGRLRASENSTDGVRRMTVRWRPAAQALTLQPEDWRGVTANADDEGNLLLLAWTRAGDGVLARWRTLDETWEVAPLPTSLGAVAHAAIAHGLAHIALIDPVGRLLVVRGEDLGPVEVVGLADPQATARFLAGGRSLVAAGRDGSVAVLLEVPRIHVENRGDTPLRVAGVRIDPGAAAVLPDDELGRVLASRPEILLSRAPPRWTAVRRLAPIPSLPTAIAAASSRRDFLVGGIDGSVALYHATSGRKLLEERWLPAPVRSLAITPRGDALLAVAGDAVLYRSVYNPHPEVSLRTLLLPVWYEGYAAPKWLWQSTGGTDSFERKLSLVPLISGTLKATLYAMLVSVPLALLAALYVSQLAPPWLQTVVKPTVELMAAVPSVVVGFLAALWLAPRLELVLLHALLAVAALPLVVLGAAVLWKILPARWRRRAPAGIEFVLLAGAGVAVLGGVTLAADGLERWLFDGDLVRWLFTEWGLRYDQRNALVVGIALGFAVIPIIFTIAEDACSSVPRSLTHAARALGATRWQAAVRMILPAAAPGLAAAVILGFGRAVGETMIVLMASGNTPLLDLGPLNGMRTMAASIAVEIPEAAVGGTLYRVLFVTGLLLFAFTFVITTVAGGVGRALRKRYAKL